MTDVPSDVTSLHPPSSVAGLHLKFLSTVLFPELLLYFCYPSLPLSLQPGLSLLSLKTLSWFSF